jgi:hypothetical protein
MEEKPHIPNRRRERERAEKWSTRRTTENSEIVFLCTRKVKVELKGTRVAMG